jgi:hypothetical protein
MLRENVTMEGRVTLSRKEITRLTVLNRVEKGEITGKQAATFMAISLHP